MNQCINRTQRIPLTPKVAIGCRVQVLDKNPVYFKRTGRLAQVQGTSLHIRFDGDERVIGGFLACDVAWLPETPTAPGETLDEQLARLEVKWADNMHCWLEEALVAIRIAAEEYARGASLKQGKG